MKELMVRETFKKNNYIIDFDKIVSHTFLSRAFPKKKFK